MTQFKDAYELHTAILSCAGMMHLNRSYRRSFSLNILIMNSKELIDISMHATDVERGLHLMSESNRESGNQFHREVNRRVHNFVAAAKTLIDHTRTFMNEHYASAEILDIYKTKVKTDFADEPVARFVQDLRNYMLHKGLPASEMFVQGRQDPNMLEAEITLTSGVRYHAAKLDNWEGWSKHARSYISNAGQYVEIETFTREYTEKVMLFQNWMQTELNLHHAEELTELQKLQERYRDMTSASNLTSEQNTADHSTE